MNNKEMKINKEVAELCGANAAAVASFLWNETAKSTETAFRYERFWVKASYAHIMMHIPFLTEDMVRSSIRKLTEEGIIMAKALNKKNFDHTRYYTFTDYGDDLMGP